MALHQSDIEMALSILPAQARAAITAAALARTARRAADAAGEQEFKKQMLANLSHFVESIEAYADASDEEEAKAAK